VAEELVYCQEALCCMMLAKKSKAVPVYTMKGQRGSRSMDPLIPKLGCLRGRVVIFTPLPLYPMEGISAPIEQKAVRSPDSVWPFFFFWRTENILLLLGLEHLAFHTLVYFL
jgi:hypothetical protein